MDDEEVEEVNLVRSEEDAVIWLVEITGCDPTHALEALKRTKGVISDALDVLPSLQQSGVSLRLCIGLVFLLISAEYLKFTSLFYSLYLFFQGTIAQGEVNRRRDKRADARS